MVNPNNTSLAAMMKDRHPSIQHFGRFFDYAHLPPHLQVISKPFAYLAAELLEKIEDGPELTVGLRKLVEAKDCCVRAALPPK